MARCTCVVVGNPNPPTSCNGCLHFPSLIVLASDPTAVVACGGEGSVNLLQYATTSGCSTADLQFQISSHSDGVTDLLITDGILSFTGVPELDINEYASVNIKVSCPSKSLATYFNIQIGFKNECIDVVCASCNPCTGLCLTAATVNINSTCGASSTSNVAAASVLTGCTGGTLTYNIVSKPASITAATISSLGVISYSISATPLFGVVLPIKYEIHCSLWGLVSTGYLNITIPDLCIGEEWDDTIEECNKCTGEITDREADLFIDKFGVGFKDSGGVGFIN